MRTNGHGEILASQAGAFATGHDSVRLARRAGGGGFWDYVTGAIPDKGYEKVSTIQTVESVETPWWLRYCIPLTCFFCCFLPLLILGIGTTQVVVLGSPAPKFKPPTSNNDLMTPPVSDNNDLVTGFQYPPADIIYGSKDYEQWRVVMKEDVFKVQLPDMCTTGLNWILEDLPPHVMIMANETSGNPDCSFVMYFTLAVKELVSAVEVKWYLGASSSGESAREHLTLHLIPADATLVCADNSWEKKLTLQTGQRMKVLLSQGSKDKSWYLMSRPGDKVQEIDSYNAVVQPQGYHIYDMVVTEEWQGYEDVVFVYATEPQIKDLLPRTSSGEDEQRTMVGFATCTIHLQTVAKPIEDYDCDTGYYTFQKSWSPARQHWCCDKYGRGCPPTTTPLSYDCVLGLETFLDTWSVAQRAWCCMNEEVACNAPTTTAPYVCDANGQKDTWSLEKLAWCCDNKKIGCMTTAAPVVYQCIEEDLKDWSLLEHVACCSRDKKFCPTLPVTSTTSLPFNCFHSNIEQWSGPKKDWCCDHLNLGCPELPTTTTYHEDCSAGIVEEWSSLKADWCCRYQGFGCPTTTVLTTTHINCHQELAVEYWSKDMVQYCCAMEQIGCPTAPKLIDMWILFAGPRGLLPTLDKHYTVKQDDSIWGAKCGGNADECGHLYRIDLKGVEHNNLGGNGPDSGKEGLFYTAEGTYSENGLRLYDYVTVEIHDMKNPEMLYTPWLAAENGIGGRGFAQITQISGNSVEVAISFKNKAGEPLDIHGKELRITVYDMDTGLSGGGVEYVTASGFSEYLRTPDTTVALASGSDQSTATFKATMFGDGRDNPSDAMTLTGYHKSKSVVLVYRKTSSLILKLGSSPLTNSQKGPRFTMFAFTDALDYSFAKIGCIVRAIPEEEKDDVDCNHPVQAPALPAAVPEYLPPIIVHAAAPATPSFDCQVGLGDWFEAWPKGKKDYCCSNFQLGCTAYDCSDALTDRSWVSRWTDAKKAWCCDNEKLGCAPYDCSQNLANWEVVWGLEQKQYCCKTEHIACAPFNCDLDHVTSWSPAKQTFCCKYESKGCDTTTPEPFNCQEDLHDMKAGWSKAKKAYCCNEDPAACGLSV